MPLHTVIWRVEFGVESVAPAASILYTEVLFVCLHYTTRTLFELQVKGVSPVSKRCVRIIIAIRHQPIKHFSLLTVSCESSLINKYLRRICGPTA